MGAGSDWIGWQHKGRLAIGYGTQNRTMARSEGARGLALDLAVRALSRKKISEAYDCINRYGPGAAPVVSIMIV